MKNQLKKLRLGAALIALPLIATATASAQQSTLPSTQAYAAQANAASATEVYLEGNRSHSVSLNRVGQVEGRITTGDQAGELNVYFVRDGKIVTRTTTEDNGYFIANNVTEGNYSFIATGQGGFVAYGVQVRPYDASVSVNAMEAATVSSRYQGIERILKNSVPSQIAREISNAAPVDNVQQDLAGANIVKLNAGELSGRVASVDSSRQPVNGTEVFIIQNDREVARTIADANGNFSIANLNAGMYDFIAAGSNGIAAVRFQAVNGQSVLDQDQQTGTFQPVSFRKSAAVAAAASLQVCLTCDSDSGFVGEQIDYAAENSVVVDSVPFDTTAPIEYASDSLGCGCAAGGSCGGAGSFSGAGTGFVRSGGVLGGGGGLLGGGGGGLLGGASGFGRLISLGGLAGSIVAISDDNNGRVPSVSPSATSN